jgi:hypothetical protein
MAVVRCLVDDVDRSLSFFRARPIRGPGGQQALIEDPSGNPVEIFQPRADD